jgi:hypothetical protein
MYPPSPYVVFTKCEQSVFISFDIEVKLNSLQQVQKRRVCHSQKV